jgi:hypothetical protein
MRIVDVIFTGDFKDIFLKYFLSKLFNCDIQATNKVYKWRIFYIACHRYLFFKPSDICYRIYNHLYQNIPSQTL